MTKDTFLKALKKHMQQADFHKDEQADILEDYGLMIDEALERGDDETAFIEQLGTPSSIVRAIKKDTYPAISIKTNKIIALSPFIALIAFFLLGSLYDAWHPGWLVFMLMPITAISLKSDNFKEMINGLSFFVFLSAFILFGSMVDLWHPLWALFITMIGIGYLFDHKLWLRLIGLYTIIASSLYITLIIQGTFNHSLWFLIMVPGIIIGLLTGHIHLEFNIEPKPTKRGLVLGLSWLLLTVLIFLFLGFYFSLWHPGWLVFLCLPIAIMAYTQIVHKERIEPTGYTPFIATIIFFLWGHYADAYQISWLVFLLIPITGILFEKKSLVQINKK